MGVAGSRWVERHGPGSADENGLLALAQAACAIPLRGRGHAVRAVAFVDPEDFERIAAHRWHLHTLGYAARKEGPVGEQVAILMHREVMGVEKDEAVDHFNRNKLDNRRSNLRLATQGENLQNQRPRGRSKYRGVSMAPPSLLARGLKKKWIAKCQLKGKQTTVGYFHTEQEAADAAAAWRATHMPFSTD